ncbi:MAG: 3-oxoacyl-[acyl-carrier-protein] reductase [Candidatus Riflebacteria bacterium]|nr:3-oxoacyl-[acyl-carrier-protein] reductase [Candidatus Riflebacteria bacterium]
MHLKDRVALVTGATRGIGKSVAALLASHGARVVVVGTDSTRAAQEAQELASRHGVATAGFGCDVSIQEQVDDVVDETVRRFERIDILVNNAGIVRDGLLLRMSSDDWDRVLAVNLKGAFLFTRKVCRHMLKQHAGAIVNLSSVIGLVGSAGQANYAASKAGIIGFTKSIAKEFASKSIRANVVAPGFIDTDMTDGLSEARKAELLRQIPLNRLGTVEDVARAVAFLVSDEAAYITGQVLQVDGGMVT